MAKYKIISDPEILGGKPVIKGTRISVEVIMNFIAAGMSIEEINEGYPELEREEIQAAISYAAKMVSKAKIRPVSDEDGNISFINPT